MAKLAGGCYEFQSPLGEVVKETSKKRRKLRGSFMFQSPLGEVVKETAAARLPVSAFKCFNPLSGKW